MRGQPGLEKQNSRPRSRFLANNLAYVRDVLERSVFAEHIARQSGLLQSLDPRTKLLATLGFLLAISLSRNLVVIGILYLLVLAQAWRSAVPLGFFVKRVWLFMPFFTGIIAVPALFLVPGPPLVRLLPGIVVTRTGATTALFLLARVGVSVSTAVLLVLTTPWNSVLKSLGVLRVPDVFVVMIGMTYRYIYLLLRLTGDMFLSRQSRVVGRMSGDDERRVIAASAGVLLSRSLQLSEEVYLAMQSRGLRGYPRTIDTFRWQARDWVYGGAALAVTVAAIWLGR
jgi:cobalt/nickel transport system permease protein